MSKKDIALEKCDNNQRVRFGNAYFEKEGEQWTVVLTCAERMKPLRSINPTTGRHWNSSLDFLLSWATLPDPLMKLPEDSPLRHWKAFL